MDSTNQIQRLADATYHNIEDVEGDMRSLAAAAKTLHKAMSAVSEASDNFNEILLSVGLKASNLPGAVSKIGNSIKEISTEFEQSNKGYKDWVSSWNSDFCTPLLEKLDREHKDHAHDLKSFKHECKKRQESIEKAQLKLKSIQKKKQTREMMEKETQVSQVLMDEEESFHSFKVESLRKALIEERRLYCFLVHHLCTVIHNQITYSTVSHQVLSTKVNDWSATCDNPSTLPPESAMLLRRTSVQNLHSPVVTSPSFSESFDQPANVDVTSRQEVTAADIRNLKQETAGSPMQSRRTRRPSCRVKALYPYQATTSEQLEFTSGDMIDALDQQRDGWQFGSNSRTGKSGWFPVQYVDQIWPSPQTQRRAGVVGHSSPLLSRPPPIPERDYNHPKPAHANRTDSFSSTPLPSQEPGPPQFSTPTTQQPQKTLSFSEQIQLAAASKQQN